jgi:hypothetical protein
MQRNGRKEKQTTSETIHNLCSQFKGGQKSCENLEGAVQAL